MNVFVPGVQLTLGMPEYHAANQKKKAKSNQILTCYPQWSPSGLAWPTAFQLPTRLSTTARGTICAKKRGLAVLAALNVQRSSEETVD